MGVFMAAFACVVIYVAIAATTKAIAEAVINIPLAGQVTARLVGAGATFYVAFTSFMAHTSQAYQTITLRLSQPDNKLIERDFDYTYFHPDTGKHSDAGQRGFATLHGVPVGLEELDVSIRCPGYRMKDDPPLRIRNRCIHVILLGAEAQPLLHQDFPFVNDLPARKKVLQQPKCPPKDVSFHYENTTSDDLDLLLYDCHGHYAPRELSQPETHWLRLPFRAGPAKIFEDFDSGSGWYVFFVRDAKGTHHRLASETIFQTRNPWLIVTKNGGTYVATFRFDP